MINYKERLDDLFAIVFSMFAYFILYLWLKYGEDMPTLEQWKGLFWTIVYGGLDL
jgi:hypothetical protein